jgi:SsrA-binding protein
MVAMAQKQILRIINKKARYDYEVLDTLEAGVVLTGAEVKSLRLGRAQLKEAHVVVVEGQAQLVNMHVSPYPFADTSEYEPARSRVLLLKRKEIESLRGKLEQKGWSAVPLQIYEKHNRFKVEVGIVRGKKQFEKREQKKRADVKREVEREVKAKYRG